MNQEKIREVALRVAREIPEFLWAEGCDHECGVLDHEAVEFLTRCLAELSKDVEPVGWWNGKETAYFEHETDGPVGEVNIPIYLHPPLTEQNKLDAERWRYARINGAWESEAWLNSATPEEIDSAIDRAMENGK